MDSPHDHPLAAPKTWASTAWICVMTHATVAGVGGIFNIASPGILPLSQVVRKLGRAVIEEARACRA